MSGKRPHACSSHVPRSLAGVSLVLLLTFPVCACTLRHPIRDRTVSPLLPDIQPRVVAIGPVTSGPEWAREHAYQILAGEFIKAGFDVVERGRLFSVLQEPTLADAGFLSPENAVEAGRLVGADFVLLCSVEIEGRFLGTDARLACRGMEAETGRVMWMGNARSHVMFAQYGPVRKAARAIVKDIIREFSSSN